MLVNLLPGLREDRTPLACGHLWLILFGIKEAPALRQQTHSTFTTDLTELHHLGLNTAGWLAAISFLAYIVGATWEGLGWLISGLVFRLIAGRVDRYGGSWLRWPRCNSDQNRRLMARVRRENALEPGRNPPPDDDSEIVHPPHGLRGRLTARLRRRSEPSDPHQVRLGLLLEELSTVPTRPITGKRDLWSEWDRLDTEARFRITVAIPVAAAGIAVTDAVYAHTQPWLIWCGWVASAVALFGLGVSKGREATEVLLQALHTGELGQLRTLPRTTGP